MTTSCGWGVGFGVPGSRLSVDGSGLGSSPVLDRGSYVSCGDLPVAAVERVVRGQCLVGGYARKLPESSRVPMSKLGDGSVIDLTDGGQRLPHCRPCSNPPSRRRWLPTRLAESAALGCPLTKGVPARPFQCATTTILRSTGTGSSLGGSKSSVALMSPIPPYRPNRQRRRAPHTPSVPRWWWEDADHHQ